MVQRSSSGLWVLSGELTNSEEGPGNIIHLSGLKLGVNKLRKAVLLSKMSKKGKRTRKLKRKRCVSERKRNKAGSARTGGTFWEGTRHLQRDKVWGRQSSKGGGTNQRPETTDL